MNNDQLTNTPDSRLDDRYEEFEQGIINHFNSLVNKDTPIFTTNAESLWETYLNNLSIEGRQHYNCGCCKHFIEKYGNLVIVREDGTLESAIWPSNAPPFFKKSAMQLRKIINESRINGVFISDNRILGTPQTGIWSHLHISLPKQKINKSRLKTANQLMAEKLEDNRMLNRALQEYSLETINQSVALLETESVYRGDKCLGVAKWFKSLHEERLNTNNSRIKENITWVYVANAPNGFCHVKSSMIGTLLDDIASGMDFDSVSRRFAVKMSPSNYMRSQVAPSQGNIDQAERIIKKMGIADSLRRRYARFDEISCFIWKNNYVDKKDSNKKVGIFSNIVAKVNTNSSNNNNLPSSVMTWEKFQRTVLPSAENIEVTVDNSNRLMALVTASDDTSENILLWDNPFSWYYHGGIDGEIKRRVENAGGKYENNEIRCSLIWEGYTDLDLHCVTPRAEHIFYNTKIGSCGGWLDIDMNGGNHRDPSPVENIRWSNNAPNGRYKFYVHNYCERGNGYNPFKAELEINGSIYTYNGVAYGTNYNEDVFSFDYIKGRQPIIQNSNSYSSENSWDIPMNKFIKVKGIIDSPNLWGKEPITHSGNHIFFLLEGCKDLSEGKGRGFFNEMLIPELREIRKTLEAYTSNTPIENLDEASACGVGYTKDNEWNLVVKVTSNGCTRIIKIDRWD